jgi:predicted metal-dependent phosphoesterase TrpH
MDDGLLLADGIDGHDARFYHAPGYLQDNRRMSVHYPHDVNVDLHTHSTASDGALAPHELIQRAARNGVRIMALTDHDTLAGQKDAMSAARDLDLHCVSGVEISVTWGGETLHVVGLGFRLDDPGLSGLLESITAGRQARARAMADGLVAHGLPDIHADAQAHARNPNLIGRTHIARALVQRGLCADMNEVFQRYLTPGKQGYQPHQWASLSAAVGAIRGAGGVAVLAHPARYRLSALGQWALLDEFKTLGGTAVEVVTGSHTDRDARRFQQLSIDHGLHASRGSDFHAEGESRFDVGAVPPLPDATRPVWHGWMH